MSLAVGTGGRVSRKGRYPLPGPPPGGGGDTEEAYRMGGRAPRRRGR